MKIFIGLRGRDRMLRVWVESYGRRSPLTGDDVAARIMGEVLGTRLIEDDYRCFEHFRDEVIAPLLSEASWTLTETEIREWRETYKDRQRQPHSDAPSSSTAHSADDTDEVQFATVSWGNGVTRAEILQATTSVLLLEGEKPAGTPLSPGSPVRVGLPNTPHMLPARLAAYGHNKRYLVALGSRAVRGAARVRLDLRAVVQHSGAPKGQPMKVVDLSSSGARLRGAPLPVGSEFEVSFVPPGRHDLATLRCVVVRSVSHANPPEIGVAFCGATLSFTIDLTQARQTIAR